MNRTGTTLLLTSVFFSSCCERELYPVLLPPEPVAPAPAKKLTAEIMTILPGEMPDGNPSFLPVTKKIHALLEKAVPEKMTAYTETVPLSNNATFDLVPIPGGEFVMGSPDSETGHIANEGPQKTIKIDPFWMATTETTWSLYQRFMESGDNRNKNGTLNLDGDIYSPDPPFLSSPELTDAVSQPTPPHTPMHFNMGDGYTGEFPAIAMTQHAASKFCEWISAQTGHYYRLPTEAEWEYACRANTTTAYFFGDDASKLGDYAWFRGNAEFAYEKVGTKKPNPWGLHDMHGNVLEWTLDAHRPDYSATPDGAANPLSTSPKRYPRIARGGSWETGPEQLRSASRTISEPTWKTTDPQVPKSIWYFSDHLSIGFRIIRPLKVPSVEEMHLLWNTGPGKL